MRKLLAVAILMWWVASSAGAWTEEIVYSKCVLRGVEAQEEIERVGDSNRVGMSIDEGEGYITLWSEDADSMIAAEYVARGVYRNANSLEIRVKYSGEGWLDIVNVRESTSEKEWADKYFLGKTIWGRKTIEVDPCLYVNDYGRVEMRIAVSDQTITVKSIEVKALSSRLVRRIVRTYRYFPSSYCYTVYHYRYPYGYVYIESGPYGYVKYEYWWGSSYYVSYRHSVYKTIICHHPPVRRKYIGCVSDPPVWVVKATGCSPRTFRVVDTSKPKTKTRSVIDNHNPTRVNVSQGQRTDQTVEKTTRGRFRIIGRNEEQTRSEPKMAPSRTAVNRQRDSSQPEKQTRQVGKFRIVQREDTTATRSSGATDTKDPVRLAPSHSSEADRSSSAVKTRSTTVRERQSASVRVESDSSRRTPTQVRSEESTTTSSTSRPTKTRPSRSSTGTTVNRNRTQTSSSSSSSSSSNDDDEEKQKRTRSTRRR